MARETLPPGWRDCPAPHCQAKRGVLILVPCVRCHAPDLGVDVVGRSSHVVNSCCAVPRVWRIRGCVNSLQWLRHCLSPRTVRASQRVTASTLTSSVTLTDMTRSSNYMYNHRTSASEPPSESAILGKCGGHPGPAGLSRSPKRVTSLRTNTAK